MLWRVRLDAIAMTPEAAMETFKTASVDVVKTNFEDANKGPSIWGHMSRQSGLTIERNDPSAERAPGFPSKPWTSVHNAAPDLLMILQVIVSNARLSPDPNMNGTTDCYCIPLDDIETARQAIAKALPLAMTAPPENPNSAPS